MDMGKATKGSAPPQRSFSLPPLPLLPTLPTWTDPRPSACVCGGVALILFKSKRQNDSTKNF